MAVALSKSPGRSRRCAYAVIVLAMGWASPSTILAQRLQSDGVKELSDQIASSMAKEHKRKIGIVPFTELHGRSTVFGTLLAEDLTTRLVNVGTFEVIERAMIDKIFAELKLSSSGTLDAGTARQVGRLAGVDALVTGSIAELPSVVAVNCRLIDVETGRIFAAGQTRIVKDDDVKAALSSSSKTNARADQNSVPPLNSFSRRQSASAGGLEFRIIECVRAANSIECQLTVVAREDQDIRVGCDSMSKTKAFDKRGRQLTCDQALLAGQKTSGVVGGEIALLAGIESSLVLRFDGATPESVEISRLDIDFAFRFAGWRAIQFRDVPVVDRR
jgi:curli biogenesis system outer membrane secretion channel CsgG